MKRKSALATSAFFCLYIILLNILFNIAKAPAQLWLSDKFFVFFFSPILLIVFTLINRSDNLYFCVRTKNRLQVFLTTLIQRLVVSNIFIVIILLGVTTILMLNNFTFVGCLSISAEWYLRYFFGAILISELLYVLSIPAVATLRMYSPIILYGWIVLELSVITPKSSMLSGKTIRIIFSWLFSNDILGVIIIPLIVAMCCFFVIITGKKKDLL